MSDLENTTLPEWAVGELQRPVKGTSEQRQRIMDLVRTAERPRRRTTAAYYPRWFRRGLLSPSGAAMAAAFAAMVTFFGMPRATDNSAAFWAEATVIKDTVVASTVTGRIASAISDTLRIVRFAINAPGATRIALLGEFNAWSKTANWLTQDEKTGMWIARVAVPRDAGRYAFVVDGDEWVGAPVPVRVNTDSVAMSAGRVDSI
ncbi:MAG: hypothetical protein H7Z40_07630 [Phycisphaerae bacterium]|nr:hypothetical protein [Gemmatimonadaceae bacterium]